MIGFGPAGFDLADGTQTASENDWLHNLRNHREVEASGAEAYHALYGG
jgi:hypothetical protein